MAQFALCPDFILHLKSLYILMGEYNPFLFQFSVHPGPSQVRTCIAGKHCVAEPNKCVLWLRHQAVLMRQQEAYSP